MLSKSDLQRLANRQKVALGVLEKEYVLTEVLNALPQVPVLSGILIFKGGTALRKAYFSDWRYSEDLDFTVRRDMAKEELRKNAALLEKAHRGKVSAIIIIANIRSWTFADHCRAVKPFFCPSAAIVMIRKCITQTKR